LLGTLNQLALLALRNDAPANIQTRPFPSFCKNVRQHRPIMRYKTTVRKSATKSARGSQRVCSKIPLFCLAIGLWILFFPVLSIPTFFVLRALFKDLGGSLVAASLSIPGLIFFFF
jgi:hypothetical protein